MNLRIATLDDLNNIAHLHATSWQENYHDVLGASYLKEDVFNDRLAIWTERLNNRIENQLVLLVEQIQADKKRIFCGFICVYGDHHHQYGTIIDNLHISGDSKGKGLGTQLISAAGKWANEHYQHAGIYLEVLECNHKARGFYEALGATNEAVAYWNTPCRNKVKEFIYAWSSPKELIKNS
jgi:ribosomal protein S18 acetylase RimI-like enzyme